MIFYYVILCIVGFESLFYQNARHRKSPSVLLFPQLRSMGVVFSLIFTMQTWPSYIGKYKPYMEPMEPLHIIGQQSLWMLVDLSLDVESLYGYIVDRKCSVLRSSGFNFEAEGMLENMT